MRYALATTAVLFILLVIMVLNTVIPMLTQSILRLLP